MNSSPFLLPPEIMFTLTDKWLDRCQSTSFSYNIPSSVDWSKSHYDASHPHESGRQQLDSLTTWHFPSRSSRNAHRSFHNLREQSPADVPDLSRTPFSCDSSVSGSASLSLDSFSDDDFAYYAPDLDALGSSAFDLSVRSLPRKLQSGLLCAPQMLIVWLAPEFSHPSFPCFDSADTEIHSPKPIFGYNTFEFDFDRPQSCVGAVGMSRHKRHRDDDENGFEDIALPKKRKLSDPAPGLLSLFPRDIPSGWNSCSPLDTINPGLDVFSMQQLVNCTNDWADDTWLSQ